MKLMKKMIGIKKYKCHICKNKFNGEDGGFVGGQFFCDSNYKKGYEDYCRKNKINKVGKLYACVICGEPASYVNTKRCLNHLARKYNLRRKQR